MPTITVKRGGKPAAKSASKPAAKAAPKSTAPKGESSRKTAEDLAALVPDIVKMRKGKKSWDEIQTKHGVNAIVARKALAAAGFTSAGESKEVEKITGSGKTLATRIAKERRAGSAFYALAIATGKSETELKNLLAEHGFEDEASGRIYKSGETRGR